MKRLQSLFFSTVLIVGIIGFSSGWFFAKNIETGQTPSGMQNATPPEDPEQGDVTIRNLQEVWGSLKNSYYDASKLNREKLEYGAVKGFVDGIGDPYTVYMDPEESKEFENDLDGELEGIGAELEVKNGQLLVVTPLKNSPAEKAGVRAGDFIFKIDEEFSEDMTLYGAVRKIRGKKGTKVTLTVIRENLIEPKEITITRSEIVIDTITVQKLDGDIFHLAINQFNDHTRKELNNAIQRILLEKAKGVILDVRGNGGGYLDTSIDVLSHFITGEKTAVVIKKKNASKNEVLKTNGRVSLPDVPLVVLVNKGSASASEIVAGALQDHKRALVIGETTFGKGSVQEVEKLRDGSRLRMTIAKWFTPNDRSIDEVGIVPDIEVKLTEEDIQKERDPQLDAAVKHLLAR